MPQATNGKEEGGTYSYTVNATVAEVEKYYQREMVKAGWQAFATSSGNTENVFLIYQKGSKIATIGIATVGGVTLVVISA